MHDLTMIIEGFEVEYIDTQPEIYVHLKLLEVFIDLTSSSYQLIHNLRLSSHLSRQSPGVALIKGQGTHVP